MTREGQRGNLLCLWGLLSSGRQWANLDCMRCGNSEEGALAEALPIYMHFGKSFSFPVRQLPLLSIREKNEMTSNVLYVQEMFPLLPLPLPSSPSLLQLGEVLSLFHCLG